MAEAAGWQVITGEKAMIYQGIEQQKAWLGCQEDDLNVKDVVRIVGEQVRLDKASDQAPPE
jgi:quinate dehydrogenase